jgi:hypothetical protein
MKETESRRSRATVPLSLSLNESTDSNIKSVELFHKLKSIAVLTLLKRFLKRLFSTVTISIVSVNV